MHKDLFLKLQTDCKNFEAYREYEKLIGEADRLIRVKLPYEDPNYIYYEQHHILPKCLFPEYAKDPANLLFLTAQEHYLAHKYLAEMFPDTAVVFAFWRLCTDNRGRSITAVEYEHARLLVAEKSRALNTGRIPSPETRAKIVEANTGRKHSKATKLKMSNSQLGRVVSEETCKKISLAKKGKPGRTWTDEERATLSAKHCGEGNPMYGKNIKDYMTIEAYDAYKQNLSIALTGHEVSAETRKKLSEVAAVRFAGAGNPKAKRIMCVEDNLIFDTLAECGEHYGQARHRMTKIANSGYSKELNKTFKIL